MGSNIEMGRLLDVLGNETRRRILLMLTKRPYFVSELSQELKVGQKAVLEHLKILEEAGLIEGRVEKIPRGRPRKYYEIKRGFRLEVLLTPHLFGTEMYEPGKPKRAGEYEHAKALIKAQEPIEVKMKEISNFLMEIEDKIQEYLKMKAELEEVRLLMESYLDNLMRRLAQESEEEFERVWREIEKTLPDDILKEVKRIRKEIYRL
ncbi:ArsR family transcriptional regulator [Palaeococcus pacificus DY20341]|uniref:ArsR family transcriptional regulator n=1 Tax=Palaeococcus pacificus DY20341 TaxID=1343739 RepID=A0A075LYV8_9EURY|nr:ArsR family transcriptional regulator [Palaeococcus pacificus]AIF69753.1 ArsR family transcriptional regulator [Palaeococcus pacificus DY20341]